MQDHSHRKSFSWMLSAAQEPAIVLEALIRLRWLAVLGQLTATTVAVAGIGLQLPLIAIGALIALTAASNVALEAWRRLGHPPRWLVQTVLLSDVGLLTALLYLTGGPRNPFSTLYLVHVAMAVIVLDPAWTWIVVGAVACGYALLFANPVALPLPPWAWGMGHWVALGLVAALIAVFVGYVVKLARQRERELASARERAAQTEQLAALTTLAAGAAHELNTPLGTIAVVAREMELNCAAGHAGGDDGDSLLEDAKLIRREVDRCRAILNRMRADVGDDVLHCETVPIDQLMTSVLDELDQPERARVAMRCAHEPFSVDGPSHALRQSLVALLRNAFDASGPGKPVSLDIIRENGHIRFIVSDEGSGMTEQTLRRAGEPFFTTKEPGKGMGLGLFLVRLVARRCGGNFTLESKLGHGTRCVLEIPENRANDGD